MSSTHFKVKYKDNFGRYGHERETHLYVHIQNTSDVTTIYDADGQIVFQFSGNDFEKAIRVCEIINENCPDKESWDGQCFVKK